MLKQTFFLMIGVLLCAASVNADELAERVAAANPDKGAKIAISCQACHSTTKGGGQKIGPELYNVVGRKVASLAAFNYSPAMAARKDHWSLNALDEFLTDPMKTVPGTAMAFPGVKSQSDRADLLAWLRLQADQPIDLPTVSTKASPATAEATASENPEMALLPAGKGREEVFYVCSVCHSIKLVIQQGLSRDSWKETLNWMVEEQGMNPLDEATHALVLDYLAEHFGINGDS